MPGLGSLVDAAENVPHQPLRHGHDIHDSDPRTRVRELVLRHGYNSNDFLALYDSWQYYVCDEPPGAVMYVKRGRTLIACGDPLTASENLPALLRGFVDHARGHGCRAAFLGASERLAAVAAGQGFGALKVGEEPFFDLADYAPRGDRAKKVRSAVNQARRSGVTTQLYRPADGLDAAIEAGARRICQAWQAGRPTGELGFGLTLEPFTAREVKRYVIARHDGRMVGFLACSPMTARDAYYLEDVIRAPDAPNGVTELLVLTALAALRDEGVRFATLGVAPLAGVERQPYGQYAVLRRALSFIRQHLNGAYHFASLNHYKRKYAPSFWEGSYLLYRPARMTPALAWSLVGAFTPESPLVSLRDTIRRRGSARAPTPRRPRAPRTALLTGMIALVATIGLMVSRTDAGEYNLPLLHLHLWIVLMITLGTLAIASGRRWVRPREEVGA